MLSSILSRGKGDRQDLFQLYLERKEVSSCRLRGKLSSLLSRDVSFLERKEVSSCRLSGKRSSLLSLSNYIAWEEALLLSRMRWKTSTLFLKTGGALSMFILGASSLESS